MGPLAVRLYEFVFGNGTDQFALGKRTRVVRKQKPDDLILYTGTLVLYVRDGCVLEAYMPEPGCRMVAEKDSQTSEWLRRVPEHGVASENGVEAKSGPSTAPMIRKRGRPPKARA